MPFEPVRFFSDLGMVPRRLFGAPGPAPLASPAEDATNLIMLDGIGASFALAHHEGATQLDDRRYLSWAWSSNVSSHVEVAVAGAESLVVVRRWDSPGSLRRFTLKSVSDHGPRFLDELERLGPPRSSTAISRALYLFQVVRDLLSDKEGVTAIQAFHSLLRAAIRVAAGSTHEREHWLATQTFGEVLDPSERSLLPDSVLEKRLYNTHRQLLLPDPTTGLALHADLLLRHAAGVLYQEAHLEIERERLLQLPLLPEESRLPAGRREVVFTPPGLTRVLVERAMAALDPDLSGKPLIDILDPACGSGVFLVEALLGDTNLRESTHRRMNLVGIDISAPATAMARLALQDAAAEASSNNPRIEVIHADALRRNWGAVDVVLMNPPFVSWEDQTNEQRDAVVAAMGGESQGRPDMAMAFISKAIDALRPGGVLATVLPSSLLSTQSGRAWRQRLSRLAEIQVVGRFQGSDIFPTALVEPAVLVLRKRALEKAAISEPAVFVLSRPGGGDAALRALRSQSGATGEALKFDLYQVGQEELDGGTWLPRPYRLRRVVRALERHSATTVSDVFVVRQGIRTGANNVFVLSREDWLGLPRPERASFRAQAGNKTLRKGQLLASEYVFFPYGSGGLEVTSEAMLKKRLPHYYRRWLAPAKDELLARARGPKEAWWGLMWARSWQFERRPKLVSSYFGGAGRFALDETGEYVVGQGYAWLFKQEEAGLGKRRPSGRAEEYWREMALSYLALLNSRVFESLLAYYSHRLAGGQLDLSPRFVNQIPLPDFTRSRSADGALAAELRRHGRLIADGKFSFAGDEALERLVSQAYGAQPEDFSSLLDNG